MQTVETLDYLIKSSWLSIASLYTQLAQRENLTRASGLVLLNIDEKEGVAATKIAPIMGMQNTSLSRLLKTMEGDGLIIRKTDKSDARRVRICLSKKGKDRRKAAEKVVNEFNDYLDQNIDKEEMACFVKVIGEVSELTAKYKTLKKVH